MREHIKNIMIALRRRIAIVTAKADLVGLTDDKNRLERMIDRAKRDIDRIDVEISKRYQIINAKK